MMVDTVLARCRKGRAFLLYLPPYQTKQKTIMEFLAKRMITPLGILLLLIAVAFGFSNINNDGVSNVMPSIEYGFVHHDWPLMIGTVLLVIWLGLFVLGFVLYFTNKNQS